MAAKKKGKRANPLKGIARALDAALHDEALARSAATGSKRFHKEVAADRRGTLSRFKTVRHALEDREKIEREGGKGPPRPKR